MDECEEIPNACSEGRCLNTVGSFKCTCTSGLRHDITTGRCVGMYLKKLELYCIVSDVSGVEFVTYSKSRDTRHGHGDDFRPSRKREQYYWSVTEQ